jgi:hypothetical protein
VSHVDWTTLWGLREKCSARPLGNASVVCGEVAELAYAPGLGQSKASLDLLEAQPDGDLVLQILVDGSDADPKLVRGVHSLEGGKVTGKKLPAKSRK